MDQKGLAQILTLGLIAAVLIAGISFGYVKYFKNENENTNTVSNVNESINTNTNSNSKTNINANTNLNTNSSINVSNDEIAEWQSTTVDDSYWGNHFPGTFNINYPDNWEISSGLASYRISNKKSYGYGIGAQPDDIFIFSIKWQTKSSEENIVNACKSFNDSNLSREIINEKEIQVSGLNGYQFDYTVLDFSRVNSRQTCLFKDDYLVVFLGNKLDSPLINYYNAILSTFQFTD